MKRLKINFFKKFSRLIRIKLWLAIMLLCLGATACVPGPPGPPGPGPVLAPHMLP